MGKKGFNTQGSKREQEVFDEKKAELNNDSGPRLRLNLGMNILWVLPGVGETPTFVTAKKIHYGPFHVCGRAGKITNEKGEEIDDRNFKNCYRCMEALNAWKDAGYPGKGDKGADNPYKNKFKDDMPTDSGLIQVVDFTPFFQQKGRSVVFNEALADVLPVYIRALGGDQEALEELPDEKMRKSAEAGVAVVSVNNDLKNDLIDTERELRDQFDLRAEGDKSLRLYVPSPDEDAIPLHPEAFLVNIDRSVDKSKSFTGRDGTEKNAYSNKVTWLTYDNLVVGKGTTWAKALPKDELIDVAVSAAVDLVAPEEDLASDASLETKAAAFVRLNAEDMAVYLKASSHSFGLDSPSAQPKALPTGEQDSSEGRGLNMSDPDNFDTDGAAEVVASAAKREAMKAARARLEAEEDED